jgi:hypothetical protein
VLASGYSKCIGHVFINQIDNVYDVIETIYDLPL